MPTLSYEQKTLLMSVLNHDAVTREIIDALHEQGAQVYVVGGCIRDCILGIAAKDIDIEVHGLSLEQLHTLLSTFGTVSEAGKSFGVLRLAHSAVEWALPRTDSVGRKPQVILNPALSIAQALERRDLTINALAVDCATFELVDPFGGFEDLQKRILRSPNLEKFVEDPLRFLSHYAVYKPFFCFR